MPLVLLIRHGETDFVKKNRLAGRLPGVPLNKKGRAQALAVAERLEAGTVVAVFPDSGLKYLDEPFWREP